MSLEVGRFEISDATATVIVRALEKLALWEGLNSQEQAAMCVLRGVRPVAPRFARSVVREHQRLEPPNVTRLRDGTRWAGGFQEGP